MTIPAGCGRIVVQGTLRGGHVWQTGWWGVGSNFADNAGCQTIADSTRDTIEAAPVIGTLQELWDSATRVDTILVYGYPDGGPTAGAMAESAVTGVVGTGNGLNPLQAALVATTLTGNPGRSYRGRMYWPITGTNLITNQVTDSVASDLATATAALLHHADGSTDGPVVLSQRHGTTASITSIRVDSKVDTQRRRAQSEAALYVHTVAVPS